MAAVLRAIIRRRRVNGFVIHGLFSSFFYVCNVQFADLQLFAGGGFGLLIAGRERLRQLVLRYEPAAAEFVRG